MGKNDARRLDHLTLEAMRERAVRSVQDGESPEVVAGVLSPSYSPKIACFRVYAAIFAVQT